jgi:phosphoribosylformylglycinamidine synthase
MSAKGKAGMKVWLNKVPTRQENMKPWEILLSESQERMLMVVKKGMEKVAEEVFAKWDLNCAVIGEVTDTGMLEYYMFDELVAEVPAESLVLGGGAPVYDREQKEPAYYKENKKFEIDKVEEPDNLPKVAAFLTARPNIASKKWVSQQYDSMVGIANTSTNRASDAAMIRIEGSNKFLAVTVDCNARYVWTDPFVGAQIAVAEAARNIVCSGAEPSAITNCLNFGNPYLPEVYWQFVNAVKGMGKACEAFGTPVTGGNVSFYNQSTDGGAVFPTPTIGMIGLVEDKETVMSLDFKNSGDKIYVIGEMRNDISSSEYLLAYHEITNSPAPHFELETEVKVQRAVIDLIKEQVVTSAHDISEGGLFINLLESAIAGKKGFEIETDPDIRKDAFLFGEAQSRIVVTVKPGKEDEFLDILTAHDVEFSNIGIVTSAMIYINKERWGVASTFQDLYDTALEKLVEA